MAGYPKSSHSYSTHGENLMANIATALHYLYFPFVIVIVIEIFNQKIHSASANFQWSPAYNKHITIKQIQ